MAACLVLAAVPAVVAAAGAYVGRSLDSALHELAESGHFQLVYTSELVPADAIVHREPGTGQPLDVVAQLLAPLGLELQRVDARTYAIVRPGVPVGPPPTGTPPAVEPLNEVIVTASRYSLASDLPDVHAFLTQGDVEGLPRLAEDPLKAVHRLPGAASNGMQGLAQIRGGASNETLILLDGLPLYEPFHLRLLQSPSSVLDERIVGQLEAYAGGFTAEYGDRMSGIIDARSLHPQADAYYELGISLIHTNALASHTFADGRGQWLASFRRSNLDEVADVLQSEFGDPRYMDGFARVDYAWSPATRGSLHALLATDKVDVTNSAETEHSHAEYSNAYLWATLEHDWSPRLTTSALVSFTDVAADREATLDEPGLSAGHAVDERDYDVLGLKVDATYTTERWMQRAGLDVRTLSATYDYQGQVVYAPGYPFPGATSFNRALAPSPAGEHYAAYYTLRGRLTDAVTAEFGLRWDEQTYGADSDNQLGPRVNLAWRIDDRTRLLASWGRYQQFQGIEELPVEDGIAKFEPAQHADHTILGLERDVGDDLSLRVEAYRKDYDSLRTRYENLYDPLSLAPELRWDRIAIDPSSARAEGVELLFSMRQATPWNAWFSYAWSRVTDREDGHDVRRSWDQTHTLNGGLGWAEGPWQATLVAQYHTGWPVTPIALDAGGNVVVGTRNADRYADYASVDARLSYEWALPRGTLTAHAELTNAFDRRNPCCTDLSYEVDPSGVPRLESELRHWLPLVPNVGVLWKF
ncbi:MAG TPA: TonB-dependent receptor [Steroidobacteraceae bacterium]